MGVTFHYHPQPEQLPYSTEWLTLMIGTPLVHYIPPSESPIHIWFPGCSILLSISRHQIIKRQQWVQQRYLDPLHKGDGPGDKSQFHLYITKHQLMDSLLPPMRIYFSFHWKLLLPIPRIYFLLFKLNFLLYSVWR